LNKSQQAMAIAMAYPDFDGKGGRGKAGVNRQLSCEFSREYLRPARLVLRVIPDDADARRKSG
jgi:hypothetical protein